MLAGPFPKPWCIGFQQTPTLFSTYSKGTLPGHRLFYFIYSFIIVGEPASKVKQGTNLTKQPLLQQSDHFINLIFTGKSVQ